MKRDLPNPHFEQKAEITQDERDKMLHFNTHKYWHCYFDVNTHILYNEYFRRVMDDGFCYLLNIGLIDSDCKQIKYFEE